MRIHTGTITDIDRIALSNYLYELSESFATEAKSWRPSNRRELERSSRLLAELGRGVLSGAANYQRAEAYADAGAVLIAEVRKQRKTITGLITTTIKTRRRRGGTRA